MFEGGMRIPCAICLLQDATRPLGKPSACSHLFCRDCLVEWAKTNPSCPIDRVPFSFIEVLARNGRTSSEIVHVEVNNTVEDERFVELGSVAIRMFDLLLIGLGLVKRLLRLLRDGHRTRERFRLLKLANDNMLLLARALYRSAQVREHLRSMEEGINALTS